MDFKNKTLLITGGTGSFGRAFTEYLLKDASFKKLIIFSRDELKQFEMSERFKSDKSFHKLRFFIGDIRDKDRIKRALENVEYVIHACALKQVPAAEYNPFECIKTNVLGAQNLIESCLDTPSVKKVIALSTDKAASPINLYGASKLCSDKLFVSANNFLGDRDLSFSIVRYGNVMGSRGSVIPFFLKLKENADFLPITDERMTRFNILLEDGVRMVSWALEHSIGGEVFVPKIPSYKITTLAKAIAPEMEHRVVGIRPGEKIHEEMISSSDSLNTIDLGMYFAILPFEEDSKKNKRFNAYQEKFSISYFPEGETYDSGNNDVFLSENELTELIKAID